MSIDLQQLTGHRLTLMAALGLFLALGFQGGFTATRGDEQQPASNAEAQMKAKLGHDWPPVRGKKYPDLVLPDYKGKPVKLSAFEGKVLIIQPVGIPSPGSVGLTGGEERPAFREVEPQKGLKSLDKLLADEGINTKRPDLVIVHILFYGTMTSAPSLADAQAWVRHFDLEKRPNTVILVGDQRYVSPATFNMIPGVQLVDRNFILQADSAGHRPADDFYKTLLPMARDMMEPPLEAANPFPGGTDDPVASGLFALLEAGRFGELEDELARLHKQGRLQGDFRTHLSRAIQLLVADRRSRRQLDDWCKVSPQSPFAFLVRGIFKIEYAWEARGGGYAKTVTEEGWKIFTQRLQEARQDLEYVRKLDPTLPDAPSNLITVAMGLGLVNEELSLYFDWAKKADPNHIQTYVRFVTLLLPKWHGSRSAGRYGWVSDFLGPLLPIWASPNDALKFAYKSAKASPDEAAMSFLTVIARLDLVPSPPFLKNLYFKLPWVKKELEEAFERLDKTYPRSGRVYRLRSQYAAMLGDDQGMMQWRVKAADLGDPESMMLYAVDFRRGRYGVAKNLPKAYLWMRRAAEEGEISAYTDVGIYFAEGLGVKRNEEAAVAWFQQGAEAGNANSMERLGIMSLEGRGLEKSQEKAAYWFRKAVQRGDPRAKDRLKELIGKYPDLRRPEDQ